jgi:DNA helicase HerA-like ATPase
VKNENGEMMTRREHIVEAFPLGILRGDAFERGGDSLAIPPKTVRPATEEDIKKIYESSIENDLRFCFSKLSSRAVEVPVDGNKFFNKHIAVVGATGSGKSHTVASILQKAVAEKSGDFQLNNTHIIIFDIHSEYGFAFPNSNIIDISSLVLPYWLMKGEDLEELLLDTDGNDHNHRNVLREAILCSRRKHFDGTYDQKQKLHLDSPVKFCLKEVLKYAGYRNIEKKTTDNKLSWKSATLGDFFFDESTMQNLFANDLEPGGSAVGGMNAKLMNFISRLENKLNDKRLQFLFSDASMNISFEETLEHLLGFGRNRSNVTILDLSGIPFEVLSTTVSLISRLVFEYGYIHKRIRCQRDPQESINNDIPILLVYEEAHKYVPNSNLAKFRSSKEAIERIAKEGRKYGISMLLSSQRPSEISETVFSQCNNFIAMRLTNPDDQNYVKKLLPDTLGSLVDKLVSLRQGEALLAGESVVLPSIVQIDRPAPAPSSNDIPFWKLWKEEWKDLNLANLKDEWQK